MVISVSQQNNFSGSNFCRINFKLDGNVAYTQALSWLVFVGNRPWPLKHVKVSQRSKKSTPRSNFRIAGTILSSISNERYWWVLSGSVEILAIWRHMTSQWCQNCFLTQIFTSSNLVQMSPQYMHMCNEGMAVVYLEQGQRSRWLVCIGNRPWPLEVCPR